jgi:hypothetical protein
VTDAASTIPPKTIRLIPSGKFASRDVRAPWTNDRPNELLRATRALAAQLGGKLVIDYDHATDFAAPKGYPAPAAGWLSNFRLENGGELWADVEWTDAGARAVASREWAYLSPVFNFTNQERRVTRLERAALVNDPALYNTAIAAGQSRAETALGAMALVISSNRGDSMASSLTPDQKKIAASFGIPEAEFAQKSARLAASAENPWALTDQQRKIAKTFGMPERRLACATARTSRSPGLLRAHQEIDRANNGLYSTKDSYSPPPEKELLDLALSELKSYDPDDDDTYDNLLKGVLYAARLLDVVAPPFVDNKDID